VRFFSASPFGVRPSSQPDRRIPFEILRSPTLSPLGPFPSGDFSRAKSDSHLRAGKILCTWKGLTANPTQLRPRPFLPLHGSYAGSPFPNHGGSAGGSSPLKSSPPRNGSVTCASPPHEQDWLIPLPSCVQDKKTFPFWRRSANDNHAFLFSILHSVQAEAASSFLPLPTAPLFTSTSFPCDLENQKPFPTPQITQFFPITS